MTEAKGGLTARFCDIGVAYIKVKNRSGSHRK
jgi:hypothetical protein